MPAIKFKEGALEVDAAIVAEGLGIAPPLVRERINAGKITSLCKCGLDEDEGRYRLTFFSETCRLRLVVDETGNVIKRSVIDFRPFVAQAGR